MTDDKAAKMAAMMDKVDEYPETWKWDEHGDTIQGTFQRLDWGPSQYTESGKIPIYVIEDDNGKEWSVWGRYDILRREFAEQNVQPGDYVGIKNLGKPAGKNYVKIVLRVLPSGAKSIDWGRLGTIQVAESDEFSDIKPVAKDWDDPPLRVPDEVKEQVEDIGIADNARMELRQLVQDRAVMPSEVMKYAETYGFKGSSVGELLVKGSDDVIVKVTREVQASVF